MPYFPFSDERSPPLVGTLSRTYMVFPRENDLGISQLETFSETLQYLKDRQGMLMLPLQGKLFRQGSPGDYLGLLHLRVKELPTVL